MIAYLTSCEFNQDVSGAKKITNNGSVIITDRGSIARVLLSFEDYQRLTFNNQNIVESKKYLGFPCLLYKLW